MIELYYLESRLNSRQEIEALLEDLECFYTVIQHFDELIIIIPNLPAVRQTLKNELSGKFEVVFSKTKLNSKEWVRVF